MSNSVENDGLTVTIKYGKGFEASWAVFRGTPASIRRDMMVYFGIPEEAVAGLAMHEVTIIATKIAQGTSSAATILGATPIKSEPTSNWTGQPDGDPWGEGGGGSDSTEAEPEGNPNAWLIERLSTATEVDELKRLWAENKSAFSDAEVQAAYSERGKELTT